jgi:hypothetical protein
MQAMKRILSAASLLLCLSSALAAQLVPLPPPPPPSPATQTDTLPAPQSDATPEKSPSGPGSWTISGAVVSATTGSPLDRTEVSLTTPGPRGSTIASALTSENGGFRFDHLQAGRYRLEASRRGYIAGGYQDHDGYFTGIVAGPNLNSQALRLELLPTAIIGGVVTDDSGEPVGGAQVHLFRQDQSTGESKIVGAGQDMTDDTGTYEFARLKAGTYYVGVSATPWYAFHPARKTDAADNPLPDDQQPHSPLDVAYAMTFFENATDSASASPISLNPGDRVETNLSMHAVSAIHIRVTLRPPGEGPGRGMAMPMLTQDVFGEQQMQPGGVTWMASSTSRNGNQTNVLYGEFSGIAPGHYTLRQFAQQGDEGHSASVDLATDQTVDFTSASVSGVDVSGKVAMASGAKLPDRTSVMLMPASGGQNFSARAAVDGRFDLHSVPPGIYELQVHASGASIAVAQMAANGADVQGSHITVATDPVLVAATLATGSTTITGYAKSNGKAIGGAMILLVPRNPNAGHQLFRRDQSNTDGSFTLTRVVPGNYILVAIENGWTLDWAQPEVIARYLAGGLNVQVKGQKSLDLTTAVEVEPR